MVAAGKGNTQAVTALLSSGADPRRQAKDGSTAGDWARKFGRQEVAALLDEHKEVHLHSLLTHWSRDWFITDSE